MEFNEKAEAFLTYGISQKISKKEILEMDILIGILSLLISVIGKASVVWNVAGIIVLSICIVATFSKQEIKGEKIFFIYGIWSICLSVSFALLGTKIIFLTIEEKYYFALGGILLIIYSMILIIYIGIILRLIRKEAYSNLKKTNGKISALFLGMCGFGVANLLAGSLTYESLLRLAGVCAYLVSLLSMLGCFNLIKYYFLNKYFSH